MALQFYEFQSSTFLDIFFFLHFFSDVHVVGFLFCILYLGLACTLLIMKYVLKIIFLIYDSVSMLSNIMILYAVH